MSKVKLLVICRWIATFQAAIAGNTWLVGRILGWTLPCEPPNGRIPLVGITGKTLAGGPTARLNAGSKLSDALGLLVDAKSDWLASTGRFCVTAWPKFEPNTPMS